MAIGTLACNCGMCPSQNIIIVVGRENCRLPVGICSVACSTIIVYPNCVVIWVNGLVVIVLVTANTGARSIVIAVCMALGTIACNGGMCAGERVSVVVIERRRRPGRLGMAGFAGSCKLCGYMVWVSSLCEICRMATIACTWRINIITLVAGCTFIGNWNMGTSYYIIIVVGSKCCWTPSWIGCMANCAIG